MRRRLTRDGTGAALIGAGAAAYCAFAYLSYPLETAMAPLLAGAVTGALAIAAATSRLRHRGPETADSTSRPASFDIERGERAAGHAGPNLRRLCIWLAVAVALFHLVGVLPASAIFVAVYLRAEGRWTWPRALVAGALTALALAVFMQWLMGARLQGGVLLDLFRP